MWSPASSDDASAWPYVDECPSWCVDELPSWRGGFDRTGVSPRTSLPTRSRSPANATRDQSRKAATMKRCHERADGGAMTSPYADGVPNDDPAGSLAIRGRNWDWRRLLIAAQGT